MSPFRVARPAMCRAWTSISFLHWSYPVAEVQALVPEGLRVQTYDGSAWVGITPFMLRRFRPLCLVSPPFLADFPETNLRTYVDGPAGPGIWFFSLDVARSAAAVFGRVAYWVPYDAARMEVRDGGEVVEYTSSRRRQAAALRATVTPGAPLEAGEFENFLTARFRLYGYARGRLLTSTVEHDPWPLVECRHVEVEETLTTAAGLRPSEGTPHALFSNGVETRISRPRLVD